MHKLTLLALSLTLAASSLFAQSGIRQAPIPGPYMILQRPHPPLPAFTPQRFAMPMPYWMQNQQPPQQQTNPSSASQPLVDRAQQQPANTGWGATPFTTSQPQGDAPPSPGFFPGYNSGQAPNPAWQTGGQTGGQFGGQLGGQQGFAPMPAPWQQGQFGQNGWNNGGYGYGQRYGAQNSAQQ